MPIRLPHTLPAYSTLQSEGVYVMGMSQAERQDIRPLRIALLNLMPLKIETETQFTRLIGATPLQIDFHLIRMSDHVSKNTDQSHMAEFYRTFAEIKDEYFDGLIITGAPIEHLPFGEVDYWDELRQIFEWTQTHVHSTMAVCWAGMAALSYFHGIEKHLLSAKRFGCLRHRNLSSSSPIMRGISDEFVVPVSRWTEILRSDVDAKDGLEVLVETADGEPCLMESQSHRMLFNLHHFEYDSHSLKGEYDRDVEAGKPINVPANYYPDDDPTKPPQNRWKSTAHLLYGNWINEIYQTTPYDITQIGGSA